MPGTVLMMQNVDLGHTKVIKICQRETLSHQGAIIQEVCCSSAQLLLCTAEKSTFAFPDLTESDCGSLALACLACLDLIECLSAVQSNNSVLSFTSKTGLNQFRPYIKLN